MFYSTRNSSLRASAPEAVLGGLAPDGGLYVSGLFTSPGPGYKELEGLPYDVLAARIIAPMLRPVDAGAVERACRRAYSPETFCEGIFPVKSYGSFSVLDLTTGPTAAFKDAAMQLLPLLMTESLKSLGQDRRLFVAAATSGDTGSAALAGFSRADDRVMAVYPLGGVSATQRRQMLVLASGQGKAALALRGNFDDAQRAVKQLFLDARFRNSAQEAGFLTTSANSINAGRLIPQMAYYHHAYASLVSSGVISGGERINFAVPTGNFGNILAGWYAARSGLPVGRLVCASNENNVLSRFFATGVYDVNRPLVKTISPSMDILVSSNLERLVHEMLGRDPDATASLMEDLKTRGSYSVDLSRMPEDPGFSAGYAGREKTMKAIRDAWERHGLLLDPHTACAYSVFTEKEELADSHTVIIATASPYKFAADVHESLTGVRPPEEDAPLALHRLTGVPVPGALEILLDMSPCDETAVDADSLAGRAESLMGL